MRIAEDEERRGAPSTSAGPIHGREGAGKNLAQHFHQGARPAAEGGGRHVAKDYLDLVLSFLSDDPLDGDGESTLINEEFLSQVEQWQVLAQLTISDRQHKQRERLRSQRRRTPVRRLLQVEAHGEGRGIVEGQVGAAVNGGQGGGERVVPLASSPPAPATPCHREARLFLSTRDMNGQDALQAHPRPSSSNTCDICGALQSQTGCDQSPEHSLNPAPVYSAAQTADCTHVSHATYLADVRIEYITQTQAAALLFPNSTNPTCQVKQPAHDHQQQQQQQQERGSLATLVRSFVVEDPLRRRLLASCSYSSSPSSSPGSIPLQPLVPDGCGRGGSSHQSLFSPRKRALSSCHAIPQQAPSPAMAGRQDEGVHSASRLESVG